jgi:hypothetical protein
MDVARVLGTMVAANIFIDGFAPGLILLFYYSRRLVGYWGYC